MNQFQEMKNKNFWEDFFESKNRSEEQIHEASRRSCNWTACAVGTLILPDYVPPLDKNACTRTLGKLVAGCVSKAVKDLGMFQGGSKDSFPGAIEKQQWSKARAIFNKIQKARPKARLDT